MNNQDMSEVIKNLNNMLKGNNIPDNLKELLNNTNNSKDNDSTNSSISPEMLSNLVNAFQSSNSNTTEASCNNSEKTPDFDIEMLMKMKDIMSKMNSNKNDPRTNLLRSLKPYLNNERQTKVEQYVKLFSVSKIMDVFNSSGGDSSNA